MKGERIACSDLERLRIPLVMTFLLVLLPALVGCGSSDPDPADVLDRALARDNLASFGSSPEGSTGGIVAVQSLGFEDSILKEQRVEASPRVMSDIRGALGADSGLRGLVHDLEYEGSEIEGGIEVDHISGSIEPGGLVRALREAGGEDVGALAGIEDADLEEILAGAEFDLYPGEEDSSITRLDLTLAFDDPGNALPATRIRFSLTPDLPGKTLQ